MNQPNNQSQQPQYIQCPRCGAWNYPNVPQCHHCGLSFTAYLSQYPRQLPQVSQFPQQTYFSQQQQAEQKPAKQGNPIIRTFLGCFGAFLFLMVLFFIIFAIIGESGKRNTKTVSIIATETNLISETKNEEPVKVTIPVDNFDDVQREFVLSDGYYTAGIDIPAGVCDVIAVSGSGNLSSSNIFSGGVNEMFGFDKHGTDLYSESFNGLKLPVNEFLSVSGKLQIKLTFTKIESDFKPRTYDESKSITLSNGNYDIGSSIPAGIYNLVAVSGTGNISTSNIFSGGINEMFGIAPEYYVSEFRNLELVEGETLKISNGVTIKFIPSVE